MYLILTVISENKGKNTFKFKNFDEMDLFITKKYQNKKNEKNNEDLEK